MEPEGAGGLTPLKMEPEGFSPLKIEQITGGSRGFEPPENGAIQ